ERERRIDGPDGEAQLADPWAHRPAALRRRFIAKKPLSGGTDLWKERGEEDDDAHPPEPLEKDAIKNDGARYAALDGGEHARPGRRKPAKCFEDRILKSKPLPKM